MSSPSLSLHSLELYNQLSVLKIVNFNNLLFVTEFSLREQWKRPPLQVRNTEVSAMGIRYTSGRCRASRIFGPLCCFTLTRKASTMSNSANVVLGL